MNKIIDGRRSRIAVLGALFAAGFCGAPAFAAPAPAKGAARPEGPSINTFLEAYDKCQNGSIDLLGTHGVAEAVKFQAVADPSTQVSLELYQACLSPIAGYEKSCTLLGKLKRGMKRCQALSAYGTMVSSVFNNGDALAACENYLPTTTDDDRPRRRNKEKAARKCDFLIGALRRGSQNICSEAKAAGIITAEVMPDCQQNMVYLQGTPALCSRLTDESGQVLCREKAALLGAVRSKNFQACALSPWCRAMTGRRPESCGPYLVRATKSFCDQVAEIAVPYLKAKAANEARLQALRAKQKAVFSKGAPMKVMSPEVLKAMKKDEAGMSAPTLAPAPSPTQAAPSPTPAP